MSNFWDALSNARSLVEHHFARELQSNLDGRPSGPRNQPADDKTLEPCTRAVLRAIGQNDMGLALKILQESRELVKAYEASAGCEMHKGTIIFNTAVVHLKRSEFIDAAHFFRLAENEDKATTGSHRIEIYKNDLFRRNFWDVVDVAERSWPNETYSLLWGRPFGGAAGESDWENLSSNSRLSYIISNAQRIHFRQLYTRAGETWTDAIGLAYWNLVADLTRVLETEVKVHSSATGTTLGPHLRSGFTSTTAGDLSARVSAIASAHPVGSPAQFNTEYPTLRRGVEDKSSVALDRVAHGLALAQAARNQVAHQVEAGMNLFTNVDEARFVVDALLSLLHLDGWVA